MPLFYGTQVSSPMMLGTAQYPSPAILAAVPDLRRLVALGGSRAGEVTLAVTETPAGLDIAVSGGKPIDAGLMQDLAALAGAAGAELDGGYTNRSWVYLQVDILTGDGLADAPQADDAQLASRTQR